MSAPGTTAVLRTLYVPPKCRVHSGRYEAKAIDTTTMIGQEVFVLGTVPAENVLVPSRK